MKLNAVNRSRLVLDGHHFALRRFRRNLELRRERRPIRRERVIPRN
jgi:hypothetical protein